MKITYFGIFLALALSQSVFAQDDAVRTALEARYALLKDAIAKRDVAALNTLCLPDFIETDVTGGSSNLYEMGKKLEKVPHDPNQTSITTLGSIKVTGDIATVDQRYDMHTVKKLADGTDAKIHLVTDSADVWKNVNGTWLAKRTETRTVDYYANDKLVLHKVSPE